MQEVERIKSDSIELFEKGEFKLRKWHSNQPDLETNDLSSQKELNFSKEHLGTKANETITLGLNLDKQRNIQSRNTYREQRKYLTKRNILKTLAST